MIKSLYSGVAGLKTHNQRMDVIGNNISNVNTTGYKAGTVTFKDVYYQTKHSASSGGVTSGGTNPIQTGYGVQLGTVSKVMTQSGLTFSDSVWDCALEGDGFFQVMDSAGNIFYTRLGRFDLDDKGNLVDAAGNMVLGISGDPTNMEANTQRIKINIPDIQDSQASAMKLFEGNEITLTAGGNGPGGNMAITIEHSTVPFATMGAGAIIVYMDLNKDYETLAQAAPAGTGVLGARPPAANANPLFPNTPEGIAMYDQELTRIVGELFTLDMRDAMRLGGLNIDPALEDLVLTFGSVPAGGTAAVQGSGYLEIPGVPNAATPTNPIRLGFEVSKAGEFGGKYEVNLKASPVVLPEAKWNGNVLTITVPQSGNFTLQQVYDAVYSASLKRQNNEFFFNIYVEEQTAGAWTDPPTITGRINTVFDPTTDAPAKGTAANGGATGTPAFSFLANYAANFGAIATLTLPQRVAMGGAEDSYFKKAFDTLETLQLQGGYFHTPQSPDSIEEYQIDQDGVIYGRHPVHGTLVLGRISIATFVNPNGLNQVGTSYFTESLNSGPPQVKHPQEECSTIVIQGSLEMSNVDLSQEFSDMIITQRGFQANSRIITVSDTMLEELINLKR